MIMDEKDSVSTRQLARKVIETHYKNEPSNREEESWSFGPNDIIKPSQEDKSKIICKFFLIKMTTLWHRIAFCARIAFFVRRRCMLTFPMAEGQVFVRQKKR